MRQIVLDTETTGINPSDGHRIIEIGCVELIDRKLTGNNYHVYINPQREIEQEAIDVHGITNEYLEDKPKFAEIAETFIKYIEGAELVIHNAPFDVGFMDHEFKLVGRNLPITEDICTVLDTLALARKIRPGKKNNLDALCKAYHVDNGHRTLHGALLDSEILADVYLFMTGGQGALGLGGTQDTMQENGSAGIIRIENKASLKVIQASADELASHQAYLDGIEKVSGQVIWRKTSS